MNRLGQAVGGSTGRNISGHATFWSDRGARDLGTLPGYSVGSSATGINALGVIIGDSDGPGGTSHAFRWMNGRMLDLGTLGGATSRASAINDRGEIV